MANDIFTDDEANALFEQVLNCQPAISPQDADMLADCVKDNSLMVFPWRMTAFLAAQDGAFWREFSEDAELVEELAFSAGALGDFASKLRAVAELVECVTARAKVASRGHRDAPKWSSAVGEQAEPVAIDAQYAKRLKKAQDLAARTALTVSQRVFDAAMDGEEQPLSQWSIALLHSAVDLPEFGIKPIALGQHIVSLDEIPDLLAGPNHAHASDEQLEKIGKAVATRRLQIAQSKRPDVALRSEFFKELAARSENQKTASEA